MHSVPTLTSRAATRGAPGIPSRASEKGRSGKAAWYDRNVTAMLRAMGNPTCNCVTLPSELVQHVDQIVGQEGRERIVIEAIQAGIRRRQSAAFEAVVGSLVDVDVPGWETPESTVEWVRRMRDGPGEPWLATETPGERS